MGLRVLEALRAERPPGWVRAMLVAEVLLWVAAFEWYLWFVIARPRKVELTVGHVAFFVFAVGFPIAMNLLHGDRPTDSGIRRDTLGKSLREAAPATGIMAGFVVVVGLLSGGFHWLRWGRFFEMLGVYVGWGLFQQYLLQAFTLRRFRQAGMPRALAAVAAAGVFSLVHAPNWVLMGVTFGAGVVWCLLFLKTPQLLWLGLGHAVLAVLIYHAWPEQWLFRLTIATDYAHKAWGW